jgi:hypothetical protein
MDRAVDRFVDEVITGLSADDIRARWTDSRRIVRGFIDYMGRIAAQKGFSRKDCSTLCACG